MTSFIFQSTDHNYDLSVRPQEGSSISWRAEQYRSLMHPGEFVFYWLASSNSAIRGLHGWGELTSEPYLHGDQYRVDTIFRRRIRPHVAAATVRSVSALANLRIFTVRVGSNFALSETEARALTELLPPAARPPIGLD